MVDYLVGGSEEQFFYFILGERRSGAFLSAEFVVALPDDLPVGVVAVPDLRPVPAAASVIIPALWCSIHIPEAILHHKKFPF